MKITHHIVKATDANGVKSYIRHVGEYQVTGCVDDIHLTNDVDDAARFQPMGDGRNSVSAFTRECAEAVWATGGSEFNVRVKVEVIAISTETVWCAGQADD